MQEPISYMNSEEICIVCFKKREKWENGNYIDLVPHHVSYFPQIIAFVHYDCHSKIHDPNLPLTHLIQYEQGDSRKFYDSRRSIQPEKCDECGAPVTKHQKLCRLYRGQK